MSDLDTSALDRELSAAAPAGLDPLGAEGVERVAALVATAKAAQAKALDEAITNGLNSVPLLLRGPIKRIMFS